MHPALTSPAAAPAGHSARPATRWPTGSRHAVAAAFAALVAVLLWNAPPTFGDPARLALAMFAAALIGWTVLRLDDTAVGMLVALALVALGLGTPAQLYATLGNDLVWLMVGGFVLAAVVQHSGLTERWTLRAVAGAGSTMALMWRLTALIAATAFIVPSTSARAALLLPVLLVLVRAIDRPRITRALALLFPSVILLSAGASMLGAGAHLIAVDALRRLGLPSPGFLGWAAWAAPFSVAACATATWLIGRLFLNADERRAGLPLPAADRSPMSAPQRAIALVMAATVLAWATTGWHGTDAALVGLAGALAATVKRWTGIDLKTALKRVEWGLILFLASTLLLAETLLSSGAAAALAAATLGLLPAAMRQPLPVLAVCAAVALASHLVITSRTARVVVLVPTVVLPLASSGLNPALLILLATLGSGFCQSFQVSAKPVTVFARTAVPTFGDGDLLRLSIALLPFMFGLLMLFAAVVWPLQGLALHTP